MRKFALLPVNYYLLFVLLTVHCSLLTVSCDLFSGVKEDNLIAKIDAEIDWANAKKITVTVDYPPEWGVSPQRGTGNCGDTRVGYPFYIDFTLNTEYSFLGWRAYRTMDLSYNGMDEFTNILNSGLAQFEGVILPVLGEYGGRGEVTITSPVNVTLVPYSRILPRTLSTIPSSDMEYYDRFKPITISFASPLDWNTVNYKNITITARELNKDDEPIGSERPLIIENYLNEPVPQGDDPRTIVIVPKPAGLPENALIILRVGRGIKTVTGYSLEEPLVLSWKTREGDIDIPVQVWDAVFNNGHITVSWEQHEGAAANLRYRINDGAMIPINNIMPGQSHRTQTITAPASAEEGSHGFEIWIDIVAGDKTVEMPDPIVIVNIPNMRASSNPASQNFTALRKESDFDVIRNHLSPVNLTPDQIYVLAGNINIEGPWTPLGTSANPFYGRFYGMRKTVTISAMNSAQYSGFFGYVCDAAVIQDLAVMYTLSALPAYSGAAVYSFGGIAGYAGGSGYTVGDPRPSIRNCHVVTAFRALVAANPTSTDAVYMGGLAGHLQNPGVFENNSASIDMNITRAAGSQFDTYAGGLVGFLEKGYSQSAVITGCWSGSNITVTNGLTIYAGGLAGYARNDNSSQLLDITGCYATGDVSALASNSVYAGGLVGYTTTTRISRSWAGGNISAGRDTANPGNDTEYNLGGLVGHANFYNSSTAIENCYALGNVTALSDSGIRAGGLVGYFFSSYYSNPGITKCFTLGSVTIRNRSGQSSTNSIGGQTYAGGILGYTQRISWVELDNLKMTYTAVLGSSVTAASYLYNYYTGKQGANRILGVQMEYYSGYTPQTLQHSYLSNNYGNAAMRVGSGYQNPANLDAEPEGTGTVNGYHYDNHNGGNISYGTGANQFNNPAFWTGTMLFSAVVWDTGTVTSRGYPLLVGVGGQ